jgi:hypothetical protein
MIITPVFLCSTASIVGMNVSCSKAMILPSSCEVTGSNIVARYLILNKENVYKFDGDTKISGHVCMLEQEQFIEILKNYQAKNMDGIQDYIDNNDDIIPILYENEIFSAHSEELLLV